MTGSKAYQLSDAAADWLLGVLGNERLYALVMAVPLLHEAVFRGGFQFAPATLAMPTVRRRLRTTLLGRPERVEGLLREAVDMPWTAAVGALQALETEWLRRHWRGLLRATANPALAIALAVDAREPLRQRGLRLLRRRSLWLPDWQARQAALPADLAVLLPPPAVLSQPEPDPAANLARAAGAQREQTSLREALTRQREKTRDLELELRQARQEWESREKDLRREVREARAAAERAATETDQRLAARVQEFKREALGLTAEATRLADEAAAPSPDSLSERAERVLAEQQRQNQVYGTRESIRAQIRALSATAHRLTVCMDESIKLLPEVRRVHAAVCRELERLQALVPEAEPLVVDLAAQLVARAKEASTAPAALAELDRIEQLLRLETLAEVLGSEGVRHVVAAVAQRRRLITDALHAAPERPPPAPGKVREIWDVRQEVTGAVALACVFIDGYNAIRRVPDLAAIEQTEGMPRSRDVFGALCRARARSFRHLEVVFDGQGALSAREESAGLVVVFSRGLNESQNADDYLLGRVTKARGEGAPVWLVTDDRGLRARAETFCDAFVSCEDWYRFLR